MKAKRGLKRVGRARLGGKSVRKRRTIALLQPSVFSTGMSLGGGRTKERERTGGLRSWVGENLDFLTKGEKKKVRGLFFGRRVSDYFSCNKRPRAAREGGQTMREGFNEKKECLGVASGSGRRPTGVLMGRR